MMLSSLDSITCEKVVQQQQSMPVCWIVFRQHGGWWSKTAKDGYIRDDSKALMLVSIRLEL